MRLAPTAVLLAALAAPAAAQDFSKVEVKATQVAGNVWMLEGAGGNIGVSAGPDGLLMVDDQFAPLAPKIRAALQSIKPGPVEFVLNTHHHGDHTGGNAEFGRDGVIVAHANVRTRLSTEQLRRDGSKVPPSPPEALPVVTYAQGLSLHFNGEEIRVQHLGAGHTDGDSVVHFTRSKVVHLGDQFFVDTFPYVDVAGGGSVEGLLKNLETVRRMLAPDVKLIPGHGPLSTPADLDRAITMLRETIALVRQARRAGKSLEDVKRAGVPERYRSWGEGFITTDAWLTTLYTELDPKKPKKK